MWVSLPYGPWALYKCRPYRSIVLLGHYVTSQIHLITARGIAFLRLGRLRVLCKKPVTLTFARSLSSGGMRSWGRYSALYVATKATATLNGAAPPLRITAPTRRSHGAGAIAILGTGTGTDLARVSPLKRA